MQSCPQMGDFLTGIFCEEHTSTWSPNSLGRGAGFSATGVSKDYLSVEAFFSRVRIRTYASMSCCILRVLGVASAFRLETVQSTRSVTGVAAALFARTGLVAGFLVFGRGDFPEKRLELLRIPTVPVLPLRTTTTKAVRLCLSFCIQLPCQKWTALAAGGVLGLGSLLAPRTRSALP